MNALKKAQEINKKMHLFKRYVIGMIRRSSPPDNGVKSVDSFFENFALIARKLH